MYLWCIRTFAWHCPLVIGSPKTHVNTRCKQGLGDTWVCFFKIISSCFWECATPGNYQVLTTEILGQHRCVKHSWNDLENTLNGSVRTRARGGIRRHKLKRQKMGTVVKSEREQGIKILLSDWVGDKGKERVRWRETECIRNDWRGVIERA